MAGYGMSDGSAIVRAIGDYANYKQRQEQIEYDRDQQEYQNRVNERQLAKDNRRQDARLSMQMDEAEYRSAERQRVARERERSSDAREGFVQANLANIDAAETAALDAIKQGASGKGRAVVPVDNGDGTVTVSVEKEDGTVTPFTKNPHDDNSPPFRVRKEDMTKTRVHAAQSAQTASKNNASPEETAAYIRAGFTIGEDGLARPAGNDEFISNLKEQGLSDAVKGKFVDSDVPVDVADPRKPAKKPETEDDGFKGVAHYAKGVNNTRKAVGNLFKAAANWEGNNIKKGATWVLFGDKGLAKLNDKDEVKVRPTTKVNTPEGVDELNETKETIEKNSGGVKPQPSKKTRMVVEQTSNVEQRTRAITEKFDKKREQYAAVGELYVTGNINETQMTNFMETGDMRFSKYDIEKHNMDMYESEAAVGSRMAKAKKSLYDAQVKAAKATSDEFKDDQKAQADVTKKLSGVGTAIARVIGNRKGMKPQQVKALEGEVETLAVRFMGTERYSKEAMGTAGFAAMWSSAVEGYINDNGSKDLSVMSITPYLTTVEGKYKPRSAQVIKEIASANKNMSLEDVRTAHNVDFERMKKMVHEQGGVWTDQTQEDFYEGLKLEYGL